MPRLHDVNGQPYGFGDHVCVGSRVLLVVDLTPAGHPVCVWVRNPAHELSLHPAGVRLVRRAHWPSIAPP